MDGHPAPRGADRIPPTGRLTVARPLSPGLSSPPRRLTRADCSGLAASRACDRKDGRKREFSPAAVHRARNQCDKGELSVTDFARLAEVSRQTHLLQWRERSV